MSTRTAMTLLLAMAWGACSAGDNRGEGGDGGLPGRDGTAADASDDAGGGGGGGGPMTDGSSGSDDGGTSYCGPDSGMVPVYPDAGSCPADEPKPGCPCDEAGETRPCKTGRMITCEPGFEFGPNWGPCLGDCFSHGRWEIDNLSPCFVQDGSGTVYAVSTVVRDGTAQCPETGDTLPPPEPAEDWSDNRLTVDCEGQFELCYTLRAGDAEEPSADDCTLARVCTEAWYDERGETQEFAPLESWLSEDSACARQFMEEGGYGEMSVRGRTADCEIIDDGRGDHHVFNRVNYCPLCCNTGDCEDEEICDSCMMGGSGDFG